MFACQKLLITVVAAAALAPIASADLKPMITPAPVKPSSTTPPPLLRAGSSPVSLRVEQLNKTDNEKDKKTAKRSLKIHLSNSSAEPLELKVKYALFGRSAATGDIQSVDAGDRPCPVKARASEIVETTEATAVFVEAKNDRGKRKPASGMRFIGYGVQVFIGDKMVAEAYDPLSLKESWNKVATSTPLK